MKINNISNAEVWIHDNSIAIVVPLKDGGSIMQVLRCMEPEIKVLPSRAISQCPVKFAGMKWDDPPVRCHKQLQNSRRYIKRNLI